MIHCGRKPLHQLCQRLSEQFSIKKDKLAKGFKFKKKIKGNCKENDQITSYMYHNFTHSIKKPNNCIMLINGDFILIDNITGLEEADIRLCGNQIRYIEKCI